MMGWGEKLLMWCENWWDDVCIFCGDVFVFCFCFVCVWLFGLSFVCELFVKSKRVCVCMSAGGGRQLEQNCVSVQCPNAQAC